MKTNLRGKARYLALALPFLITVLFFLHRYYSYDPQASTHRVSPANHEPNDFWVEFFSRLEAARPAAAPIEFEGKAPVENWEPDIDHARANIINMTSEDEAALRVSHRGFITELPAFARHLPYDAETTGIVTTAGAPNFGQVVTMVLMVRQSGSELPIHVVLDSSTRLMDDLCMETLRSLNVTCIYLSDVWAGITPHPPKFSLYQWKILSILASPFQNVLFLDADLLPVHNPDAIFEPGSEPFASTGLITWPDFWTPSASRLFYAIAGDVEVPPLTSRTSSESGMMVIDKARHPDTLLLAAYYNYYGADYYYALLSQHGPGEGDKETFLQAALVLEALYKKRGSGYAPTHWMTNNSNGKRKKGYWDVKTLPKVHGRTSKGEWKGMFMQQMDPMEDYRVVMAATKELNEADYYTDSSFLATVGNLTKGIEPDPTRYMFYHHNGVKLDFTKILEPDNPIVALDEEGKFQRLWGEPDWIIKNTGRDVERQLWREATKVWCRTPLKKVCQKMKDIYVYLY
ncbi:mannosyltransferase putative-domain-containing protein [Diplogelasinospora grovesii]|uniref:Mannosyltransferase putative-domain-containing protein n=1 Tax=Diplogelasinospora grovesii TaxID=303347 RepID=A0AAN6NFI6_9PEZI|nr:mannosyltransferase putative-domain-containing protein [Diplogelasinospora grovesii]